MNKSALLDLLHEARAELDELIAAVDGELMTRIRDGYNGHPRSPSFEAGTAPRKPEDLPDELRGTLDYNDPVGAVVAATGARDTAQIDAKHLLRAVTSIVKETRRARDIRVRYKPRHASLFDQQEAKEPEPGCVSCARVPSPGTVGKAKQQQTPWWNEIARTVTLADGTKVGLCEWCRAHARATGELPDKADVESYRDTGRARKRTA